MFTLSSRSSHIVLELEPYACRSDRSAFLPMRLTASSGDDAGWRATRQRRNGDKIMLSDRDGWQHKTQHRKRTYTSDTEVNSHIVYTRLPCAYCIQHVRRRVMRDCLCDTRTLQTYFTRFAHVLHCCGALAFDQPHSKSVCVVVLYTIVCCIHLRAHAK